MVLSPLPSSCFLTFPSTNFFYTRNPRHRLFIFAVGRCYFFVTFIQNTRVPSLSLWWCLPCSVQPFSKQAIKTRTSPSFEIFNYTLIHQKFSRKAFHLSIFRWNFSSTQYRISGESQTFCCEIHLRIISRLIKNDY